MPWRAYDFYLHVEPHVLCYSVLFFLDLNYVVR